MGVVKLHSGLGLLLASAHREPLHPHRTPTAHHTHPADRTHCG